MVHADSCVARCGARGVKAILPASLARRLNRSSVGGLLKLFSAAVIDQVLLSGANFAVGFILIRFTSDHDYGVYVLVQAALVLLTAVQRAWLSGPLTILSARKSAEERREMVGAVKDSQRSTLLWVMLTGQLLALTAYLLSSMSWSTTLLLAVTLLSGWATLRREYLRDVLLLYKQPNNLLGADTLYASLLVLGVYVATFSKSAAVIWAIALLCVAALAGAGLAHRMVAVGPGWVGGDAGPAWREMRTIGFWGTVGSLIYWLFGQSYNFLLAGRIDLTAVADVNATRLLLMPIMVLTAGVQALLLPTAALWYAEAGLSSLMRRLLGFLLGMSLIDLAYLAVMWLSRDWLIGTVLHKHVTGRDQLLILWALLAFIALVRDVLSCALFARGRMKSLAGQTALGAAVALLLMWFGIRWWGASAVLIGQIVGELINLAGIGLHLREAYLRPQVYSAT
jgi:O-antigen/teichoic acid export membrane protein